MPRSIADVSADFNALVASDFDAGPDGILRLHKLCEEVEAIGGPKAFAPVMFRTIERLDGQDLGTPGPLVHTLESWRGTYEPYLVKSIRRKPTVVTVWMINSILNASPPDAEEWLSLLREVVNHPGASSITKESARDVLDFQTGT